MSSARHIMACVSDAVDRRDGGAPQGTALLPADLGEAQFDAAPVPPPEINATPLMLGACR